MGMDILREQIRFKKTGVYLRANAGEANAAVYRPGARQRYYIVGLLLSYLAAEPLPECSSISAGTWRTDRRRCLEVFVGHGLFTAKS